LRSVQTIDFQPKCLCPLVFLPRMVMEMSAESSLEEPISPHIRTRVGNGSAVLSGIDGRCSGARRYREVLSQLCIEITKQRRSATMAEQMLARRAAFIAIWCEDAEAKMARGEPVDIKEFTEAANTLRRTLTDAGLIWPAHLRIRM
jgi:hypothetical protein